MDYGIEGRVALVAASSKGLGKACAMGLAREGAKVALCARNDDELQNAAQEITSATGAEVFAQTADMTRPDDIEGLIGAARGHFGRIDILVTNAGGPPPGQFMDFTDDDWLAALNLNLLSTIRLIRGVMPQMQAQQWGRIVNITSVTVKQPFEALLLSNVARAGVVTLSKTLSNQTRQGQRAHQHRVPGNHPDRPREAGDAQHGRDAGHQRGRGAAGVCVAHPHGTRRAARRVCRSGCLSEFGTL